MNNATAELTVGTVSKIIAFLENAGVTADCIDPQEVLDHVTPRYEPRPDLIASTVLSVNARQLSRWPVAIGGTIQLYTATENGRTRYCLTENLDRAAGETWQDETGLTTIEIIGNYKLLGTEARAGESIERTLLEVIPA